ncbi:hypothetical protein JCM11251_003404 [Rhodosporidiobolus azoricus]
MSASQPPLPPESPVVIPPTPANTGGGASSRAGLPPLPRAGTTGIKPPSPPRVDSGVVLEEVMQQALDLASEGSEGGIVEAERILEEREQAAVVRAAVEPSPHSSGARSGGSLQSVQAQLQPQRPSPSSGRGSSYNTAWSSRSPNSRASSGSNIHEFSSARSSFERRPSGHAYPYPPPHPASHPQLHLHFPPGGAYQSGPSPYNYSPSQRTPSDGGGIQYPPGAFYPSQAFYYPQQQQQPGPPGSEGFYPHHQYGGSPPNYMAYQPFTSPDPSSHSHSSSQYSQASFPFSAAGSAYSPYATVAPGLAAPPHPGAAFRRSSSDIVYDEQGNPISQVDVSPPQSGAISGGTTYYYPQQQQPIQTDGVQPMQPHGQALAYQGPPQLHPQPHQGYQPVYILPPPGPRGLQPTSAGAGYNASPPSAPSVALPPPRPPPPPIHPSSAPPPALQPQQQRPQPISYPISSARPASPPATGGAERLVYPISHSTSSATITEVPAAVPPPPPPPPPPQGYYYPASQVQQYVAPPPPPPRGAAYPSAHPVSGGHTASAPAPLPQHVLPARPHQQPPALGPAQPPQGQPLAQPQLLSPAVSQGAFSTHSRESSAVSALTGASDGPRVYEPPSAPARGHLAQAGLRKAAAGAAAGVSPVSPVAPPQPGQQQAMKTSPTQVSPIGFGGKLGAGLAVGMAGRRDLPKPPPHSPFALWVGNVPSDASHAELWSFFQNRPTPHSVGVTASPADEASELDLDSTGIESIHLIARSNCAFVNYTSSLHLRHAITVSNGLSLRPSDPRCKTFLCRERKTDDDFKSGVGAQRVGGMHKSYIREQRERMAEGQRVIRQQKEMQMRREREGSALSSSSAGSALTSPDGPDAIEAVAAEKAQEGGRRQSAASYLSIGSGTTTSTFLAKHFERRYFILKSHDEADLKLSVQTGLWATQAHNEPVLQQAFRTAKTVYLIFGANGQGAWFGVARMAGPISGNTSSSSGSRPSWSSRDGASSAGGLSGGGAGATSLSAASQTIMEDSGEPSNFPERPALVLTDSDSRRATASPLAISPSLPRQTPSSGSESAPATLAHSGMGAGRVSSAAKQAMSIEADLVARETADNLHLPAEVVARRAATLDEARMGRRLQESGLLGPPSTSSTLTPGHSASLSGKAVLESEAEKRNLRLEAMEDKTEEPKASPAPLTNAGRTGSANWGTPFAVEWITVKKLPFAKTKHLRNSFNGNREIKISRDGTEVEPSAGEALLSVFWAEDPDSSPP